MRILLILLITGILISGCIEKTTNNIDRDNFSKDNFSKDNFSKDNIKKNWYQYIYVGPTGENNSEDARMAVIPYLRELGWMQGISVVYGESNNSIVILIPFQLTDKSIDNINKTLENFSFSPIRLNEVIEVEERPD